jgi:hypothetical protein
LVCSILRALSQKRFILENVTGRQMKRHFGLLISWMIATVASLCILLSQPDAREEETVVISGRLTGYDTHSVFVNGEHINLCDKGQVLDPADMRITTDGLVATETVEVILRNGCAIQVKALEVRR